MLKKSVPYTHTRLLRVKRSGALWRGSGNIYVHSTGRVMSRHSILVIGDLHIPFQHKHYMDFCQRIRDRVKTEHVVFIGDLVDNHSISEKWPADPDGRSPNDEMEEADRELVKWFKAFPKALLCLGNHDTRADLKARHASLPTRVFKPFREIWNLPKSWKDDYEHTLFGVKFIHGTGYSGDLAHMKAAHFSRQSTVIGHIHHICATGYTASSKDCLFGCATGTGIDVRKYAFAYERHFPKKPIVGCAVVTDEGHNCQVFRMDL